MLAVHLIKPDKYDKSYNFTEPELRYLRQECNFTPEKLQYFNLNSKRRTNAQIAMEMYISESKVSVLAWQRSGTRSVRYQSEHYVRG